MTNKSLILLALSALSFSSVQAQSLLVGWDRFNDPSGVSFTTNNPGFSATGFSGTFTVSASYDESSGEDVSDWSRLAQGSNDGTFGTFEGDEEEIANNSMTSSFYGALEAKNIDANGFTLEFQIVNDSPVDYDLSTVEFDVWRSSLRAPSTVSVSVLSGSITYDSDKPITTTAAFDDMGSAVTGNENDYQDMSISLSGLTDSVLEAGTSATFEFKVIDQKVGKIGATLFDNIGITGTAIIPESGSYALIAGLFGLASIMMRRRN